MAFLGFVQSVIYSVALDESGDNLPRKGPLPAFRLPTISIGAVVIWIIIAFFISKFLGLTKTYLNIDPYGLENLDFVSGALAIAIGVLYKEIRDLRQNTNMQFQRLTDTLHQ